MSPVAKFIAKLFELQNSLVSFISPRAAQWIRTSTPLAHFHKWYLGHGTGCFWCGLVERWPRLEAVVPYSEMGIPDPQEALYTCRHCQREIKLWAEDGWVHAHNAHHLCEDRLHEACPSTTEGLTSWGWKMLSDEDQEWAGPCPT